MGRAGVLQPVALLDSELQFGGGGWQQRSPRGTPGPPRGLCHHPGVGRASSSLLLGADPMGMLVLMASLRQGSVHTA